VERGDVARAKPEPEHIAATLLDMVKKRVPAKFGLDPIGDIQVLCPMNRGSLGIRELNVKLQGDPEAHLVVMGDFNQPHYRKSGLLPGEAGCNDDGHELESDWQARHHARLFYPGGSGTVGNPEMRRGENIL